MALQVWLPLNGNLENRGLADITVTNSGAVVDNNGKIGKCYYFDGSKTIALQNMNFINDASEFSIALWIKTNTPSNTQCLLNYRTSVGADISLFIIGGVYRFDVGGTQCTFSLVTAVSNWKHITCTFSNGTSKIYVDGSLIQSIKTTNTSLNTTATKGTIGLSSVNTTSGSGNPFVGYINDYRIYDHCLSASEVKEISKGLILHYPLNRPIKSQSNLTYASFTCYNNYGVASSVVDTGEKFKGASVYEVTMTPTSSNVNGFRTELWSHGVYQSSWTFKANTKYCYWLYYKPVSHQDVRVGGTASNINGWTEIPPQYVGNGWYRVGQYRNGTVTSDKSDNIFTSFYTPTAEAGVPIKIRYAAPYLIQGYTEIQEFDNYYDTNTTIYDCSGYGNNGAVTTSTSPIPSEDSKRYGLSSKFDTTSKYISVSNIPATSIANSYTIAWWGKSPSYSMFWGFSNGNRLNMPYSGYYCNTGDGSSNPFYKPGTTTTITPPSTNVWHHYACVGNGTDVKLYVDGVHYGTAKTYKSITGTSLIINGWDSSTSYKVAGMQMNDFRIYSTPLSGTDIQELYSTGAKITKNGTLMCYEIKEN